MSALWVPPSVSRDLRESTAQYAAEVAANARRDAIVETWTRELRKIDHRLEMIKANDDASAVGLIPGYYHVMLVLPDGPPSLLPVTGDNGEFAEPTSRVFELLKEGDLQNEQAMRARRAADEEAARRRVRDREREHLERVDFMVDRVKSIRDTRVSMTDAKPWTNANAGHRGAKTPEKKAA